jgi:hypothetical protein
MSDECRNDLSVKPRAPSIIDLLLNALDRLFLEVRISVVRFA